MQKRVYLSNKRRRHGSDSEGIWGDNLEPACKHATTVQRLFFCISKQKTKNGRDPNIVYTGEQGSNNQRPRENMGGATIRDGDDGFASTAPSKNERTATKRHGSSTQPLKASCMKVGVRSSGNKIHASENID